MHYSTIQAIFSELTFRNAVWLFPVAFLLHVFEEWPHFTAWARRYASNLFTQQDYEMIHIAGIIGAFVLAALVSRFPNRLIVFLFFAFAPGLFCNTLFHIGGTVLTRTYCPGVITATIIYLPVFFFVSHCAMSENLLDAKSVTTALLVAGAFHFWEVGHNVFKAW